MPYANRYQPNTHQIENESRTLESVEKSARVYQCASLLTRGEELAMDTRHMFTRLNQVVVIAALLAVNGCRAGGERVDRAVGEAPMPEHVTPTVEATPAVDLAILPEPVPAPEPAPDPSPEPIPGLEGAADLLASGDAAGALEQLTRVQQPESETPLWFAAKALEGRAARLAKDPARAVEAIRPVIASRHFAKHLPPEHIRLEYARSLADLARKPGTPQAEADEMRRTADTHLRRALKHSPIRNLAEIRVERAWLLAEIQGSGGSSTRVAANRAAKELGKVIRDYPNHPKVGLMQLEVARALVRAGKHSEAAEAYRNLAIDRAGEPEAQDAWNELGELAETSKRVTRKDWSRAEQLARARNARSLRRVVLSRQILDDLLNDPKTPESVKRAAKHSRGWTAYKQRDFATCSQDFGELYAEVENEENRNNVLRCLERGREYDKAIDILLERSRKKGMTGKEALWSAIRLAVRGGKYEQAQKLLHRFGQQYRAYTESRRWLDAWLKFRTGDHEAAIDAFDKVASRRGTDTTRARYFSGRLRLGSSLPEQRQAGAAALTKIVKQQPLSYYGLQARQRLLDAGEPTPELPTLTAVPDESDPPNYAETVEVFEQALAKFEGNSEAVTRAAALHRAGYIEEARRELRIAIDEFVDVAPGFRSGGYVPRNEDRIVGLGWKAAWKQPKLRVSRDLRKHLRKSEVADPIRDDLRVLALSLHEPHRMAKLTKSDAHTYKERWHPRAFRPILEREAAVRDIDPTHLWSLMYTESRFRRHVVSHVGARGALQIMPWTGRQLAERLGECDGHFDADTLFDIDTNAKLASYYISELIKKFHGQAAMAYASYNGGPSNVARWLAAKSADGQELQLDAFIEEIPFSESARYTRRVLEVHAAYNLMYNGELPRWTNEVDTRYEDNIDF